MSVPLPRRAGLGQVFRIPEFRALWLAELVSVAGDQLARVGLGVLVYGRTGSAAWAAVTYALTFLPALLGGVLFGRLADRYPRRAVMIATDAGRAVLVLGMALPGVPLPVLCALLVAVVLLGPAHAAAQGALLPEVAPGPGFDLALTVRQVTNQAAQVGGFVVGGVLVALVDPAAALALNAATFAVSALVVAFGVAASGRPTGRRAARSWAADTREGLHTVLRDPRRRVLVAIAWLVGCLVLPEALAVPYAEQLGLGPGAAGVLMAADPAGSVVGAWAFTRFVPPARRGASVGPLALAAALPLGLCVLGPGLAATVVLWALSGACATACLVQCQADFVRLTPNHVRGRAIGVAASGLVGAQGVAMLLGGVAAQAWGTRLAVAACGAVGLGLAAVASGAHARAVAAGGPVVDVVRVAG